MFAMESPPHEDCREEEVTRRFFMHTICRVSVCVQSVHNTATSGATVHESKAVSHTSQKGKIITVQVEVEQE